MTRNNIVLIINTIAFMERRVILFNQHGDGGHFLYLSSTTNPSDNNKDLTSLGDYGVLYLADILAGEGDRDHMILFIPSIGMTVKYDTQSHKFVETASYIKPIVNKERV